MREREEGEEMNSARWVRARSGTGMALSRFLRAERKYPSCLSQCRRLSGLNFLDYKLYFGNIQNKSSL